MLGLCTAFSVPCQVAPMHGSGDIRRESSLMPEYFNRPPRIQPELPEGEFEVPAPPTREGGRQSLVQLALPLITVAGYVLVSGARGGGAGSLLFIIPMALSIVVST